MKKNILLVEDDFELGRSISELLSEEGYHVISADCGCKAIAIAENQLPDLIICETRMKDMDGYEVFTALFSKLFKRHVHFIYFTKFYGYLDKKKVKVLSLENFMDGKLYDPDLMAYVKNCLPA